MDIYQDVLSFKATARLRKIPKPLTSVHTLNTFSVPVKLIFLTGSRHPKTWVTQLKKEQGTPEAALVI